MTSGNNYQTMYSIPDNDTILLAKKFRIKKIIDYDALAESINNFTLRQETLFDASGNITEIYVRDKKTGEMRLQSDFKYDERGIKIEETNRHREEWDKPESTKFLYDNNGRLVEEKKSFSGIDYWTKTTYRYDTGGNLLKKEFSSNGEYQKNHITEYKYDLSGKLCEKIEVENRIRTNTSIYHYGQNGKTSIILSFDKDGMPDDSERYFYNESDLPDEYQIRSNEGYCIFKKLTEYDDKNRIVKKSKYDFNSSNDKNVRSYVYENGKLKWEIGSFKDSGPREERDFENDKMTRQRFYYIENGKPYTKTIEYSDDGGIKNTTVINDPSGFLEKRTEYKYDEKGQEVEIRISGKARNSKAEIEFDQRGLPVKRKFYDKNNIDSGEPYSVRVYEYEFWGY